MLKTTFCTAINNETKPKQNKTKQKTRDQTLVYSTLTAPQSFLVFSIFWSSQSIPLNPGPNESKMLTTQTLSQMGVQHPGILWMPTF